METTTPVVKVLSVLLLSLNETLGNETGDATGVPIQSETSEENVKKMMMMMTNGTTTVDKSLVNSSAGPEHSNYPVIWGEEEFPLPLYIRVTAFVFLVVIFAVGTLGNTMVIIVINCSRDMRTSTNIFLVNLSIADLLVLLICTPTCIMEVYYDPETWYLGAAMCKLVPLLEMTVAHTSVLTILAISFERYYAICCPLRANYICTKARAASMCLSAWMAAGIITSPVYFMTKYYEDPQSPRCEVTAGTFWPDLYTISSIVLFFILPLLILIVMYRLIAKNLTSDSCRLSRNYTRQNHRARRQVIMMLGTVVFTFFLCLLPFRVLTLYILLSEVITNMEVYYNLLYFCRIMLYINSALNPILYNIMSSKFRNGFLNLCSRKRRKMSRLERRGTFHTMTTTSSVSTTSNIPNNFVHAVSSLPESQQQRRIRQGFALYGQCCRCQCHDYVTHVWLSSDETSSNGIIVAATASSSLSTLPKNKCKDKRRGGGLFSRNNNNNSTPNVSTASTTTHTAHWYCRKCKENSKWESKYLFYGSSSSPTATTALILNQRNSTTSSSTANVLADYNSYPPSPQSTYSSFHARRNEHHHHHHHHHHHLKMSLFQRCCSFTCQSCKSKPATLDRYEFSSDARGCGGGDGKVTIKMALNSKFYSVSSFSNTNTIETNL